LLLNLLLRMRTYTSEQQYILIFHEILIIQYFIVQKMVGHQIFQIASPKIFLLTLVRFSCEHEYLDCFSPKIYIEHLSIKQTTTLRMVAQD
jgi:hypothetical protein